VTKRDPPGRLEIIVDGERWTPVKTLARCGPEDRCYVIRLDDDGSRLVFGDGAHGRRLPAGARIEARYRSGGGRSGKAPDDRADDPAIALIDLWAEIGDLLSYYQDQVSSEAYLETSRERRSFRDASDLRRAIADGDADFELCICIRPMSHRADRGVR
jgi:hypothetical protein